MHGGNLLRNIGPMRVRWVLFDVGGVLERVDDHRWPTAFIERWAGRLGLPVDEYRRRIAATDLPDLGVRTGVEEVYWSGYGRAVGADPQTLTAMRLDFWDAYCGELNDELFEFHDPLTDRVRVAILSNSGDGARREEERRYRFSTAFGPILYSHEIGVGKPDPLAFHIALDRLGAAPEEVVFTDDHPPTVEAAVALGIRAVLHTDTSTTIAAVNAALGTSRTTNSVSPDKPSASP